jgi:di/tricarboxylate transporter
MGWEPWFALGVVLLVLTLLATTTLSADLILLSGLLLLFLSGILDGKEALAGFANEGMITVGVLFVVAAGVVETGGVTWVTDRLFGRPKSVGGAVSRLMLPVAGLSAFMNNTPLVAMLIPAVSDWAKKYRIAPSKLMMPLSMAAILGGTCTLIGTSTNLVVNGMIIQQAEKQAKDPGIPDAQRLPHGLNMFDIAWVGVPATLIGIAYVVLVQRWLLPNREAAMHQVSDPREYTIEMVVTPDSPLAGKSIEQAGLRHLSGLYLAEIDRNGVVLPAVGPEERLQRNDRLVFVGIVDSMVDLQKIRGLVPATDQVFKLDSPRSERCLIEAVASSSCPVVGKTIRDGRFRSLYDAVVIAVAREGERLRGKIGDIVLRGGDTLLLEAHPSFAERHRNSRDFFLVGRLENSSPPHYERAAMSLVIVLAMVVVVSIAEALGDRPIALAGWQLDLSGITMLKAGMVAAALMLFTGCCRIDQARRSIEWEVLLAIAASLGIGLALTKTGAAQLVSGTLVDLVGSNPWLSLVAIYGVTVLVTEVITNNAAAAIMFPFALATAQNLQVKPMSFVIAVMMAASAGFATPIGYQTNLMVYGPGGYRFTDYLRIGIPLDLLIWGVTVTLAPFIYPFH